MSDFSYEITRTLGVLGSGGRGWSKELNLVSWNGREPKYDIRDWAPDHEKMGKGVTLSPDELKTLKDLLNTLEL